MLVPPKLSLPDPIAVAFSALLTERDVIAGRITELRKRRQDVENAIEAMRPLVPESLSRKSAADLLSNPARDEDEGEDDAVLAIDPSNPFSGLRFSVALHKFMRALTVPASPPELARGFEQAGWGFSNPNTSHKTNQVGVTLRRFEGKLFMKHQDGSWSAIPV